MIEQEILKIIKDSFPSKNTEINLDTPLEEIIYDSMDFIELIAILSSKYKLDTDPKKLNKIKNIKDISDYIIDNSKTKNSDQRLNSF